MTTFDLIKNNLDISSLRAKAIANNIANVNTSDFKRYYVDIENNNSTLELKTSNNKQIKSKNDTELKLMRDTNTSTKTDKNNVEIDSEKVDQAANTIYYNTLVSMANNKIALMNMAISGGK